MPDYQQMYHTLFNKGSDAIRILQEAQQKTEETYIGSGDDDVLPFPLPDPKK